MEEHQTFGRRRWPLHFALAWVLTRNCTFSERAKASDFHPRLNKDDCISGDEVYQAWNVLYQALADGRVPAFKVSEPCGNGDAGEVSEERIAPEVLASLDWTDLTRSDNSSGAVAVSSAAMIFFFSSGGEPVAFTSDHIGQPMRPDGPGFMTLSDAAYWIATEGGAKRIVVRDVSVWKGAFAELLPRVQSGEVRIVGRRRGVSLPETIDGASFVGLRVDYPYIESPISMVFCEEPHIKCYGVLLLETDGADDHSDELWGLDRRTPEWTHLKARRSDIKKLWPFPQPPTRAQNEKDAIAVLSRALRENNELKRDDAKAQIGDGIGPRAFQNRVWPEARKLAGLPPIAPAGRKRKNRHA